MGTGLRERRRLREKLRLRETGKRNRAIYSYANM